MPSIAELRVRTQPESIFARNSGEHWAGRLYMRRASPYLTRLLIPTRITPNGVTWLMIAVGLAAAAVLTLPGWWPPVVVVALIQCQLLLDCSDGELARWRGVSSPAGIYLDRMAHNLTEAALPVALAIRADGGWGSIGGWTDLGLLTAMLVLLVRIEYALVYVARAESGLPVVEDSAAVAAPRRRAHRTAAAHAVVRAVLPRVRGDRVLVPRADRRDRRRADGRARRDPAARRRARAGRGADRRGRLAAILSSQRLR